MAAEAEDKGLASEQQRNQCEPLSLVMPAAGYMN